MDSSGFAARVDSIPDAGIGSIMSFASKFENTISFGQGAPQFPTPNFVYEELGKRAKTDSSLGMYNSVNDKVQTPLKRLIVSEMKGKYGFEPDISEIYLTIGGLGGLFAALMSIVEKGDEVIYLDPSYPLHLSQIAITEAVPVYVPLIEELGWKINLNGIKQAITKKTKAIVLTNPNNPTGTVLTQEEVRALSDLILENDLYLVLDEAYEYLTYERPLFSPMMLPDLRERIVLSKSFSKEYAMTGWRIGYLWMKEKLRNKIHGVHLHFSLNPATIAIAAATIVLEDPRGKLAMQAMRSTIEESREVICSRMDRLTGLFSYVKPMGAFYLFPKILPRDLGAKDLAIKLIEQVGVITIPGDTMGPAGVGHLRFSFATSKEKISEGFDRLERFVAKM
ncbi:MAG: pyridoxal phosphate-dependent aminotransferase [Microgenomates group bacterium]